MKLILQAIKSLLRSLQNSIRATQKAVADVEAKADEVKDIANYAKEVADDARAAVNEKADKSDLPTALPNPNALTFTGAVEGSYDGSAPKEIKIPEIKEYTLPAASETALGGVKASAKTEDMTQPVGIGEDGFLFTVPGASGSTIPFSNIKLVKRVDLKSTAETEGLQLEVTEDMDGKPLSLKAFIIDTDFSSNVSYNEFDLSYGETMVRMVTKTPLYGFGSGDGVIFILSNDGKHMTCSSGRYNAWYISPLSKAVAHISKIKMGYWKKWTYFRVYEIVDI